MKLVIAVLAFVLSVPPTASAAISEPPADEWASFVALAAEEFGESGRTAAQFLREHRPPRDASLSAEFLMTNLRLAIRTREQFPWTQALPVELFHNDVLPYAVLDETREQWRADMYERSARIVAEATTASEAAQLLNQHLFSAINVHYNTGRKKPNQSPSESITTGKATCTGLSIILVDACRAVGIPARVAGVANWTDKRGNHTWVEIWDGSWHFLGADEYDPRGLNRGWFTGDASRAVPGSPEHAVWASSWRATGNSFPLVWAPDDTSVPAIDVTARYAAGNDADTDAAVLFLRLWDTRRGHRLAADITIDPTIDSGDSKSTTITTRAGRSDLNDMPRVNALPNVPLQLNANFGGTTRTFQLPPMPRGTHTVDLYWDELWMSRNDAHATRQQIAQRIIEARQPAADAAITVGEIEHDGTTLRFLERRFGDEPQDGHSLWISLHGGGGTRAEVNDQQWQNQIRLYQPDEGYYIAPRAPTDTWNLWHRDHIDPLLTTLIEHYVVARGVNPNRVYLMGYSAGGDGVYQLAPRIPDRFAAAAMMAGHPNETKALGLRNLPFAVLMGGEDNAYNRAEVAARFGTELKSLQQQDPDGYDHRTIIYPGLGHWMQGNDAEILPWMAARSRNAAPNTIVWLQDDVTHTRFYWIQIPPDQAKAGAQLHATITAQHISIETTDYTACTLLLNDGLLDLDQPITVSVNGRTVFTGAVHRTASAIRDSLETRLDPDLTPTANLDLTWDIEKPAKP